MKPPEPEEETPLAWSAVLEDTPVYTLDGVEVGVVYEVLGAEDIFHGVVVRTGALGHDVLVPADQVSSITNRRIEVSITSQQVRDLTPYQQEESFKLGVTGFLRRHLGWVHDDNQPG